MAKVKINDLIDYQLEAGLWVKAKIIGFHDGSVELEFALYPQCTEISRIAAPTKLICL